MEKETYPIPGEEGMSYSFEMSEEDMFKNLVEDAANRFLFEQVLKNTPKGSFIDTTKPMTVDRNYYNKVKNFFRTLLAEKK